MLSVLLQVGFTLGYVVSVPFMGHVGRRPQYFVSSVLLATAMVVLGASLYALVRDWDIITPHVRGIYSPLGSIKTPSGLKMPMIPRAWGLIIAFLLG